MNRQLKLYPAYKDSGEQWLGKLPEHWEIHPNRALFYEVRDRDHADEQMLSVTITKGVVTQKHLLEDSSKKDSSNLDRSAYKFVQPDDIAYNKMRAWQGAIGLSSFRGIISPAYVVERPRTCCFPRYYHHLFRTPEFVKEAERWSYGITSDMWSLRPEHFRLIYSCLPPLDEQSAIVRYLDYMDRRIQRYIRAKQKLIKLLEEQKQAIIHQAVTGQIDVRTGKPYPAYKPSGVEWLGDVPEQWEVLSLWSVARPRKAMNQPGLDLLSVYLGRGVIPFSSVEEKRTNPTSEDLSRYQLVEPGDFVLNNQQAWRGSVGVSRYQGIVSPAYLVLAPNDRLLSEFAEWLLPGRSMVDQYLISSKGVGSIQRNLYWPHLRRIAAPVPPPVEQLMIARSLANATGSLAGMVERTKHQIDLLREYRTRLISDVVTGKLDVREAAANLPDELEEELPDDQEQEEEADEDLEDEEQTGDEE